MDILSNAPTIHDLFASIIQQDEKQCLDILQQVDLNTLDIVNGDNETVLILACKNHLYTVITLLLKNYTYCDLGATDITNRSALFYCTLSYMNNPSCDKKEEINIINEILSHPNECSLGEVCSTGFTPLLIASYGKLPNVMNFLAHPLLCNINHTHPSTNLTALHTLCKNSMYDCAMALLEYDLSSSINNVSNQGYTSLSFACGLGMATVAMKILEYENICNLNTKDINRNSTPFTFSCEQRMENVAMKIVSKLTQSELQTIFKGNTYLMLALSHGMPNLAKAIMDTNLDYNIGFISSTKETAFDLACKKNYQEIYMRMIDSYPINKLTTNYDKLFDIFEQACKENDTTKINKLYGCIPSNIINNKIQMCTNNSVLHILMSKLNKGEWKYKLNLLTKYNNELAKTNTRKGSCVGCTDICNKHYCLASCGHTIAACDDCKGQLIKDICVVCRVPISSYIQAYIC